MDDTTTATAKQTIARKFRPALSLADGALVDRFIAYTCQDLTEGWPADWSDVEIRAEFAEWLAAFGPNAPAGELAARIATVRELIERLKFDRDRARLWKQAATVATLETRIAALEAELRRLTGATR